MIIALTLVLLYKFIITFTTNTLNINNLNTSYLTNDMKLFMTSSDFNNMVDFNIMKYKITNLSEVVATIFNYILLFGFFKYSYNLIEYYSELHSYSTTLMFIYFISVIMALIELPFKYYITFVINDKFQLNNTSKKSFIMLFMKDQLITLLAVFAIQTTIYYTKDISIFNNYDYASLINNYSFTKNSLPLLIGVTIIILVIHFLSQISTVFYFKKSKITDDILSDRIKEACDNLNFKLSGIYVINQSQYDNTHNAYYSNFLGRKEIVLYDNIIKNFTHDEILAIVTHELGHYRHNDMIKLLLENIIKLFIMITLYFSAMSFIDVRSLLGLNENLFLPRIIIVSMLFMPLTDLYGILSNKISLNIEYAADNYVKAMGYADHLKSALTKMYKLDLGNIIPSKLDILLNHSHPTLLNRIENLKK